ARPSRPADGRARTRHPAGAAAGRGSRARPVGGRPGPRGVPPRDRCGTATMNGVPVLGVFTIPGWSVRALFAAIALPFVLVGIPVGTWTGIAAVLIGVAVWRPRWFTAWVLIGILLLSSLVEPG